MMHETSSVQWDFFLYVRQQNNTITFLCFFFFIQWLFLLNGTGHPSASAFDSLYMPWMTSAGVKGLYDTQECRTTGANR